MSSVNWPSCGLMLTHAWTTSGICATKRLSFLAVHPGRMLAHSVGGNWARDNLLCGFSLFLFSVRHSCSRCAVVNQSLQEAAWSNLNTGWNKFRGLQPHISFRIDSQMLTYSIPFYIHKPSGLHVMPRLLLSRFRAMDSSHCTLMEVAWREQTRNCEHSLSLKLWHERELDFSPSNARS